MSPPPRRPKQGAPLLGETVRSAKGASVNYQVRFTVEAEEDLIRLYEFILNRDSSDWSLAEKALVAIRSGIRALEFSPFTCRKAAANTPFLRELVIPFGATGYVALFRVDSSDTVTILAVRHQREDDYH